MGLIPGCECQCTDYSYLQRGCVISWGRGVKISVCFKPTGEDPHPNVKKQKPCLRIRIPALSLHLEFHWLNQFLLTHLNVR